MEFTHEKYGKCVLTEITQDQLEKFSKRTKPDSDEFLSVYRGDMVRAAVDIGFVIEPTWKTPDDVGKANAGLVRWVSKCISDMLTEVMDIDPLPSSPSPTSQKEK